MTSARYRSDYELTKTFMHLGGEINKLFSKQLNCLQFEMPWWSSLTVTVNVMCYKQVTVSCIVEVDISNLSDAKESYDLYIYMYIYIS